MRTKAAVTVAATLEGEDGGVMNGAWGTDVRNADGLIVVSDMATGFWAFRMAVHWLVIGAPRSDGFKGWNGLDWGQPNISSVQDWENGPEYQATFERSGLGKRTGISGTCALPQVGDSRFNEV